MAFDYDATGMAKLLVPDRHIVKAQKHHAGREIAGYYKLQLASGQMLFAKVKSPARAVVELSAASLTSRLHGMGAPTLPLKDHLVLPEGVHAFLYPWIEGAFFNDSLEQLSEIGSMLAVLHDTLAEHAKAGPDLPPLIDLWMERSASIPDGSVREDYVRLLEQVTVLFGDPRKLAHNDLHRANLLFDEGGNVRAFLDFEDSVNVASSELVDLAAVIERFCCYPDISRDRCSFFLSRYSAKRKSGFATRAEDLVNIGLCRCYHSLAVLWSDPRWNDERWEAEVAKFHHLIDNWKRMAGQPLLDWG